MSAENSLSFDQDRRDFITLAFARGRGGRRQSSRAPHQPTPPASPQPPDRRNGFNRWIKRREALGVLTTAAAGSIFLAHRLGLLRFPYDQPQDEAVLSAELIRQQLVEFNQRLLEQPDQVAEIAPQIGNLAITYFCQEMNSTLGVNTY